MLPSVRHTAAVKLERAELHYSRMRRLLGHSIGKNVEDRVYLGSLKYSVKELNEAPEKIQLSCHNVRGGLGYGTNRAPETRPDV
jgi:hypothetical protein